MGNKAIAAGGSVALSGAITTIILSILGHPVSADVQSALTTIISAVLAYGATYVTKMEGQG